MADVSKIRKGTSMIQNVVLLSGGLDSATCLALVRKQFLAPEVLALNVYYGQRHAKEVEAARKIANYYRVELVELDMTTIFSHSQCSLLMHAEKTVPEGTYQEQQEKTNTGIVDTYVPFRNGLFLAAATSYALSVGAGHVWYAAHADDAAGNAYPDCSFDFFNTMKSAVEKGTGGQVELHAPFVTVNKAEIVRQGLLLDVPYELTWSCYNGGEEPCGKCGTCIDRAKAFAANKVGDPLCSR